MPRYSPGTVLGATPWLLMVLTLLVEIPVAMAFKPSYDPVHLTISDLGATTCTVLSYPKGPVAVCSPLHSLLNLTHAFGGVALGAGGVLLRGLAPPGWRRVGFVALMVATGASWLAAVLVPVDLDLTWHALVALPAFLTAPTALLLVNGDQMPGPWWRRSARWIGVGALVITIAMLPAQALNLPLGLIERIALYPVVLWFSGTGACVLLQSRRATAR